MERVQFTAAEGAVLDGDLHLGDDSSAPAIILCHPHPDFGGDRFHPLLTALFDAAGAAGRTALRFDFRRGDDLRPIDDLAAALDLVTERRPGAALGVIGYSFGATTALSSGDERISSIVAVAPPSIPAGDPGVPVLILVPEHDQFRPPDDVRRQTTDWADVTVESVVGTDHFLAGKIATIAEAIRTWLDRPAER